MKVCVDNLADRSPLRPGAYSVDFRYDTIDQDERNSGAHAHFLAYHRILTGTIETQLAGQTWSIAVPRINRIVRSNIAPTVPIPNPVNTRQELVGLGDISVTTRFAWSDFTVIAGVKLPTGTEDMTLNVSRRYLQPGTGSTDLILGLRRDAEREADATTGRGRAHWFWGALSANRWAYAQVAIAAITTNILALIASLFTMVVYDRILPSAATESLFALTVGVGLALVFAGLALGLRANQVAVGLAVGILGQGLSSLVGNSYESLTITGLPKLAFPGLSDLPVVGGMFVQDIIVWLSLIATALIWAMFRYSRLGLILRAIGENPTAARAIGYRVTALRLWAVMFGGAMAGFAGAYAATVYTPLWADGMIAGRGWIALALVVFGTWLTGRIFFGACLFGAVSLASLVAQTEGWAVPSQLLSSLPYIVTIVVLGIITSNKRLLKVNGVASLGEPFGP